MNVFCVLFFVLINTIGNQGDPNHGLLWGNTIPPYIVSLRNVTNGHMCTGSVISKYWVLSSLSCYNAVYFVYGLSEFKNNQEDQMGEYSRSAEKKRSWEHFTLFKLYGWLTVPKEEGWKTRPKCKHESLNKAVWSKLKKLSLPESGPPETGEVIGWVFDSEKNLMVMKKISANINEAFSGTNEKFCELGIGSPLIADGVIYGFLEDCNKSFVNVESELMWINITMKNN